jgi:hypothetical protein
MQRSVSSVGSPGSEQPQRYVVGPIFADQLDPQATTAYREPARGEGGDIQTTVLVPRAGRERGR